MSADDACSLKMSVVLAIQDAILLGNVRELDAILSSVRDDGTFPNQLRYGLEALRHFRAYYGKDGELQPQDAMQKKKMTLMESAWGAELLELVRHNSESSSSLKTA